ncbi:MAG: hypothetical protein V8S42_09300 [Lachnospiraceae bacterium]
MFNEYKITSDYIIASGGGAKSKEWLDLGQIFLNEKYIHFAEKKPVWEQL